MEGSRADLRVQLCFGYHVFSTIAKMSDISQDFEPFEMPRYLEPITGFGFSLNSFFLDRKPRL
jgi:hypothetical protein